MLKLDDEFFITADGTQFILKRRHKTEKELVAGRKAKEETDSIVGYYASVATAINRYRKEQMMNWVGNEKISLQQLCDRITELDAALKKKMRQLIEMEDDRDEISEVGRVVVATMTEKKKRTGGKKNDSHNEDK